MLDVAPTELLLVAVVALLVIGPKDLPKAMRFVGKWVGKARGVARQFRSGFDTMIRESELAEMEKQWAAENERIMREHPPTAALPAPQPDSFAHDPAIAADIDADPVMVEQPALFPAQDAAEPDAAAKPKRTRKPKASAPDEPQS
ncbi:Sec-independent protein translocase protein TatB [Sphingomonas sp. LM7]|uniref:Sec-independent protein translocase protein TatB n=1 Tax=Sphingomonas sp. LM7 TaxID=1938607 RepID=UPI00098397D7|nr:Sec-independent protein translocase protein TatB [Sphingomonas sp. LM7]AQR73497.1 twin arginine-targeting protein translocase TatB [Sphingomonas sp. LM7]